LRPLARPERNEGQRRHSFVTSQERVRRLRDEESARFLRRVPDWIIEEDKRPLYDVSFITRKESAFLNEACRLPVSRLLREMIIHRCYRSRINSHVASPRDKCDDVCGFKVARSVPCRNVTFVAGCTAMSPVCRSFPVWTGRATFIFVAEARARGRSAR